MSLFSKIAEFFQSLFSASAVDPAQRQIIKRAESELKILAPDIYKSGFVQVNFAEVLRILFECTKQISDILTDTYCSSDLNRSRHYEEQLLLTGFDEECMEILNELSYENRKQAAKEASNINRYFEGDHRKIEKLARQLNSPEFMKIDNVFAKLNQLKDFCAFGYVSAIKLFDQNYTSLDAYEPSFQPVPIEMLEGPLMDFYYVAYGLDITNSLYNAVLALATLSSGGSFSEEKAENLKGKFRKIQGILRHNLSPDILMWLIRAAKKNLEFLPEHAEYKAGSRQKYAKYLENRFRADEERLKNEIQNEKIQSEIEAVFGTEPLERVIGYNVDIDNQLKQSTPCSFQWLMPMTLLKNFVKRFYEPHVKPLFNDIIIEGYFNNNNYKTDFSQAVFACNEILNRISEYEEKFSRSHEFDEANITSLVLDSHKDSAFETTLKALIDKINKVTKELIQKETSNIFNLYKKMNDIVVESKQPNSDMITNLNILMFSSRNKENSECMETQFGQWKIFLEIMKNYVIIGTIEKN